MLRKEEKEEEEVLKILHFISFYKKIYKRYLCLDK
jgi:hypothetical protein